MSLLTKVVTYVSSVHDDAPEAHRCLARLYVQQPATATKPARWEVQGVIFAGPDKATVRQRAQDWWAAELAREERRVSAAQARADARRRQPTTEEASA